MKKIILLSLLIIVSVFGISQTALADNVILSVSPASTKNAIGENINASVQLDPAGNKVCVVKGTINLDNLSCRSITVANGLVAQTTPTCANPNFVIGIPKCEISTPSIISMSVKGTKTGPAILSLTGVSVVGSGTYIASSTLDGAYNIYAPQKYTPKSETTVKTEPTPKTDQEVVVLAQNTTEPSVNKPVVSASLLTAFMNYIYIWGTTTWLLILILALAVIYVTYLFLRPAKKAIKKR